MHTPPGSAARSPETGTASSATGADDARWVQLVGGLKDKLPKMQETFVERVRAIPEYSGHAVSGQDLQSAAAKAIELTLDAMAGKEHYPRLLEFATDLGNRRARQGLPAEALISAVRMDFPIIWATLLEISNNDDAALLVNRAEEVWRVVDDYATATHSSYLAARVSMAQEEAGVRQEFISALFSAQGRLPETRDRFAKAFNLKPDVPYAIAAAKGQPAADLRKVASTPNRSQSMFLHQAEEYTYLFWPEPRGGGSPASLGAGISAIPCGLATADAGLVDLAAAGRIAAALSDLATPDDQAPITVERHWIRLARARMDSLGVQLGAGLDGQLSAARPDELERLRETVSTFLANGSVSATADLLYCHRNTILNRMRRFKELTGIDLMVPVQAARAVIAWA
ncbi:helix-turn-helix domain-containing protein [Arthrobacter crystallopoietes]|uniref:helix-turn-helix domain-containing protein n=1 Tax=Crystallibacter crystallopoietes TaxID=37928 RepID=UPI001111596E|nr:helix-turn-helix domain-containing protein [Arthrobacter crystallopoietes]